MCQITDTTADEIDALVEVHRFAFEDPEVPKLTRALLADPTAEPRLSLKAEAPDGRLVGHVLLTAAGVEGAEPPVPSWLLAPLAVAPEVQGQGIGQRLILASFERAEAQGIDLVFVLGHPAYYPKAGFEPAGVHQLRAPYPIAPQYEPAWMVKALHPGLLGRVHGTVRCARALDQPEHWGPP